MFSVVHRAAEEGDILTILCAAVVYVLNSFVSVMSTDEANKGETLQS